MLKFFKHSLDLTKKAATKTTPLFVQPEKTLATLYFKKTANFARGGGRKDNNGFESDDEAQNMHFEFDWDGIWSQPQGHTFIPNEQLYFENDYLPLFKYPLDWTLKLPFYIWFALAGTISVWAFNKLVNYHERSILGFIFYAFILVQVTRKCSRSMALMSRIIGQISLHKDGRHVMVETSTIGLFPKFNFVEIGTI